MLTESQSTQTPKFLSGGSELATLISHKDWSATPLGNIDSWPQSLKTAVNLILNSQHPMWIGWGRGMTFLYNDAYVSVLSASKHPWALGRPASEVWAEIWDVCGPLADKVFLEGQPTFLEDVQLFMNRGEFVEETYYSFSYSPIYEEEGQVAGLFCPSAETTSKVLHARRLKTLSELSTKALIEKNTSAACASAFDTLKKNVEDIPFAILYLVDNVKMVAHLAQDTRSDMDSQPSVPSLVFLNDSQSDSLWPLSETFKTRQQKLVDLKQIDGLPKGCAGTPVSEAIILPIMSSSQEMPIGIFIAGVNPCRKLDGDYQRFFDLLTNQIGTAIQNARTTEEQKQRADLLAEIDKAKTVFFSNVTHEFRTPLALLLGPLEAVLYRSGELLPEEDKEWLKTAHRNAMRLFRLVNTLLDFSRIEAGRINASYTRVDLAALTSDLASNFRSVIEKAGLRFKVECQPAKDPTYVDPQMWEKIVFNLLSNAYKYTMTGEISVQLCQELDEVILKVKDTGVGIPHQELPKMFDRFHRVKNTAGRTFEGTGIGLSLVKELINLHQGSIRVESIEGAGSTFTVSLPLGKAHLPAEQVHDSPNKFESSLANVYVKELESLSTDTFGIRTVNSEKTNAALTG
ncbi:MAG: GAF domain-containing sensor histidine kinase, partial [Bacteroidota bacterium]|nr:GAF domain-containing sensor histidine kinase [Bacteroidota bacterium]